MTEIHPSLFYLMIEGLAALSLVLLLLLLYLLRKHSEKKRTLAKLVDQLTRATYERRETLREQLSEHQDESNKEAIENGVNAIVKRETLFYQYMVTLMLSKDTKPLLELDRQLENLTHCVVSACKDASAQPIQPETAPSPLLPPAITEDITQIRNELIKLQDQNTTLLDTIKQLSLQASAFALSTSAHDNVRADEDDRDIISDDIEQDLLDEETSIDTSEIIDISSDIESLDDFNENSQPQSARNEVTDIDALLEEVRAENLGDEIEEIPDDMLQHDEPVTRDDAVTDIDALLDEVAKENVERSLTSA